MGCRKENGDEKGGPFVNVENPVLVKYYVAFVRRPIPFHSYICTYVYTHTHAHACYKDIVSKRVEARSDEIFRHFVLL